MKSIGKPRYTPSGEFYGYVGSTQDITDVKLLEDELLKARNNLEAEVEQRTRELRESEEKYRRIVETANEGIWVLDREDVTSFVNPALARMLGCSQQEIIGRTPYDFIDATYQKKVLDALRRRRGGVEEQYICKFHRKDGGDLWAIITAHPLYEGNGEYAGAFAMLTDITERKRAEESLRERERQLVEGQVLTDTGSWEMDLVTGEVVFSDNMLRILSLSPGRHAYSEFTNRVHPEDRERRDVAIKDAIDNGKRYDIMYRFVLPDNNVRHIHAIGRVALDARGKPVKFTSTIQDITERKRAEEAFGRARPCSPVILPERPYRHRCRCGPCHRRGQ